MKAIEFPTKIKKDKKILVPEKYQKEIRDNQNARIIIILEQENNEQDWNQMTTEQFLNGYLIKDSEYDKL
jgi:hypothetical protein